MILFTNVTRHLLFLLLRSCSPSVTPLTCPRSSTGQLEPMRCTVERDDAPAFCIVAPEHRRAVVSFSIQLRRLGMGVSSFWLLICQTQIFKSSLVSFLSIRDIVLMSCGRFTSLRILNDCLTRLTRSQK